MSRGAPGQVAAHGDGQVVGLGRVAEDRRAALEGFVQDLQTVFPESKRSISVGFPHEICRMKKLQSLLN
jgi:hypothetical protein